MTLTSRLRTTILASFLAVASIVAIAPTADAAPPEGTPAYERAAVPGRGGVGSHWY